MIKEKLTVWSYNKDGQQHKDNGPAVVRCNGYVEWWYEGNKLVITSEVISDLLEVFNR